MSYYQNIEGWFDFSQLYTTAAQNVPENGKMVEIGCWKGRSICYLGETLKALNKDVHLYGVDTWAGSEEEAHQEYIEGIGGKDAFFQEFKDNMKAAGVDDIVKAVRLTSIEAAATFPDEFFDFIFIDADHHYQSVKDDIEAWLPKLKFDGTIGGHDYELNHEPSKGLVRAVYEHFGDNIKQVGACWLHHKKRDKDER
jgi:SAM-dependent methyltransferase